MQEKLTNKEIKETMFFALAKHLIDCGYKLNEATGKENLQYILCNADGDIIDTKYLNPTSNGIANEGIDKVKYFDMLNEVCKAWEHWLDEKTKNMIVKAKVDKVYED